MHILELQLLTDRLAEQRFFYVDNFRLPLLEETHHSFAVAAGTTRLAFQRAEPGLHPIYHFAFNISEDTLPQAKKWLLERCELLRIESSDEIYFVNWNAHAVYFYDPAGNIVEFIARHNLRNRSDGPFGPGDILCVSESGPVTADVASLVDSLQCKFGLGIWPGRSDVFVPLGDDNGLLIVIKSGRAWFPTDKLAEAFPTTLTIQGPAPADYQPPDLPYLIRTAN